MLCAVWFVLLFRLKDPRAFKNIYFDASNAPDLRLLDGVRGIVECYKSGKNQVVKFDNTIIDEAHIRDILKA